MLEKIQYLITSEWRRVKRKLCNLYNYIYIYEERDKDNEYLWKNLKRNRDNEKINMITNRAIIVIENYK